MNLGFALEYSLGHVTHAQNLKATLSENIRAGEEITPIYVDLPYAGMKGAWTRLPGVRSNWSLRASLGAYLGLRPHAKRLDAALFHTQVTSLLSAGFMRHVPSVISLDATPLQYDALGAFYGHSPGSERIEALKKRLNMRAFAAAHSLVTWSEWAKASLVHDYGVSPGKITVIPPGIDIASWQCKTGSEKNSESAVVQLLFVGGDFERKGGGILLDAWKRLPAAVRKNAAMHIVTRTWTEKEELSMRTAGENLTGIFVHRNMEPNSPLLRELFRQADLFVFPTRGDCLPLAVLEALAAGLPVITTSVGALSEAVQHQKTGWVIPMDDSEALAVAMAALINDRTLRRTLGSQASESARMQFDAKRNYQALVNLVLEAASSRASG